MLIEIVDYILLDNSYVKEIHPQNSLGFDPPVFTHVLIQLYLQVYLSQNEDILELIGPLISRRKFSVGYITRKIRQNKLSLHKDTS